MAGAGGDLKGKGTGREEDQGKAIQSPDINPTREPENERRKREPAASTKLAGKLAGCTSEPAASADIAGAGDLKGTGEQHEGRAIQSPDINTTRETEKKREVAACTRDREPAASTEGDEVAPELAEEQQQRELINQLTKRYSVPAEFFAAGCSSGCALVGSKQGFHFHTQADGTHGPFYVMPYMPPKDAADIESEMKKTRGLGPLLMNPDMLASKVAVRKDINSEIRKVQLLLSQDLPNPNPEEKQLRFDIAEALIPFRNRMLFAYEGKGEVDVLPYDLMSVLAFEDWNTHLYRSQVLPTSRRVKFLQELGAEPSLIGAGNRGMAVSALKKLLHDLVSRAISKGHLADETGPRPSKVDIRNLRKADKDRVDVLFTLLKEKPVRFDQMCNTIVLLKQDAAKVGAHGLETMCDDFLELYKNNNKRYEMVLYKIWQEQIDICNHLEKTDELQDLISLLESEPVKRMYK